MAASSLNDLPNELLLEVFELLAHVPERTSTFASLCRTSRRFQTLAEPFLYHSYSNLVDRGRPHIFPLSLVNRRELSKHVKKLYLLLGSSSSDDLNPILEDDFRLLRQYIWQSRLSPALTHDWINDLGRHGRTRFNACACLILALASQELEELILQHDPEELIGYSKPTWMRVIDQSLRKQPADVKEFYNLRSITISRLTHGNRFVQLHPLASAFKLPCLRHFELEGCSEMRLGRSCGWDAHGEVLRDLGEWENVKDSSVESLVFEGDLTHYALWAVLIRCKRLKHFTFKMVVFEETEKFFYFPRLDEGLRVHAASLERLFIMHGNEWAKQTFEHPQSERMTFISQCSKLSSAVVPPQAVLPPDRDYSPAPSLIEHIRKALPASVKNWTLHPDYVHWGDTKPHL